MKKTIKSIPIIGFLVRWSYNLIRLNNLKHTVYQQQKQLNQQKQQIENQQNQIDKLLYHNSLSELFNSEQSKNIFVDIKKSVK